LRINGTKNVASIFDYFLKYPLLGNKGLAYTKFLELHSRILNKDHLYVEMRKSMTDMAAQVNPGSKGRSRE